MNKNANDEKIISFGHKTINDLIDLSKKVNHKKYRIYTKNANIDKIIDNKCLRFSNGVDKWNDLVDVKLFNNDNNVCRFGLCFSTFTSESIPMWMLYGGKAKDGKIIEFSPTVVGKLIDASKSKECCVMNSKGKCVGKAKIKNMYLCDALYCSDDYTYILCNNKEIINTNLTITKKQIEKKAIVVKPYTWRYEKETRLIIEVEKSKIKSRFDKELYVDISIKDIIDNDSYSIIDSPYHKSKKYKQSSLTGKFRWELD